MYVFSIAARHIRKRGISWVAMALIACIVFLYLLIISVLEGQKEHYMDKLQSVLAHASVSVGDLAWGIQRPEKWAGEVAALDSGIRGVTAGLEIPAMAIFDRAQTVGTLRGVDLNQELAYGRLKELLSPSGIAEFGWHTQGGKQLPGCIVGGFWRKAYNLEVNDRVTFLFSDVSDDPDELGNPRSVAFAVIGFFEGKNPYLEQGAYVDRQFLAEKMRVPGQAKTLAVWLHQPNRPDLDALRARIRTKMTEVLLRDTPEHDYAQLLKVETWHEKDNKFYQAITRENLIMRFIMTVFLLLVAFVIFLIFGRLVSEKVRDIGALRAMGATPAGIRNCFLLQGLFIGLVGLSVGLVASYFFIKHINPIAQFAGVNPFPADAGGMDQIPAHTLPSDVLLICTLTLLSALVGALVPAMRAAWMDPVECLRHE